MGDVSSTLCNRRQRNLCQINESPIRGIDIQQNRPFRTSERAAIQERQMRRSDPSRNGQRRVNTSGLMTTGRTSAMTPTFTVMKNSVLLTMFNTNLRTVLPHWFNREKEFFEARHKGQNRCAKGQPVQPERGEDSACTGNRDF